MQPSRVDASLAKRKHAFTYFSDYFTTLQKTLVTVECVSVTTQFGDRYWHGQYEQ